MSQIKQTSTNRSIDATNIENAIFLVRHGQCLSNVTWPMDNYSDEIDVLTDLGQIQISNALTYFNQFDCEYKIIPSTLTRAKQSAEILHKVLNKSILLEPDERIVEKNHEETIESFVNRLESFIESRTNSQGPFILATHGHVIECMLLTRLSAPYILNEKIDGHIGIKGIHGVANGSVSALVDSNFVFFNFVP
jgi:broad specificity phosphatase PhoE